MNKILWYSFGILTAFIVSFVIGALDMYNNRIGKICYMGDLPVSIFSDEKEKMILNRDGLKLQYGRYFIKLKNGKTLVIHKNNRGNASISECGEIVLVESDINVIGVWLE